MHSKIYRAARLILPLVIALLPITRASAQLNDGSTPPITTPRPPQQRPYQSPNYGTGPLYQSPNFAGDARLRGMGGAGSSSGGQQSQSGRSKSGGGSSMGMMGPMMMMGPLRMLMGRMGTGMRGIGRSHAAAHGPVQTANGDASMIQMTPKQQKQLEQMRQLELANQKIQQAREDNLKAKSQLSQAKPTFSANQDGEALSVSGEMTKDPEQTPGLSRQDSEYRQPVSKPTFENYASPQLEESTAEVKAPGEEM